MIRASFNFICLLTLVLAGCSHSPEPLKPDQIATANLEDAGWYGWDTRNPRGLDTVPLTGLALNDLALSSPGCEAPFSRWHPLRWRERIQSCREFQEVDVIFALTQDSQIFATQLKHHHPWEQQGLGDRVRLIFADDAVSLQRQVAALLMDCKIIRRMTVSSHGNLGLIHIGNALFPTTVVLAHYITPCALSFRSRIQFTSCMQACSQAADSLRLGLENVFTDRRFQRSPGRSTFEGLQLLFNSDEGQEAGSRFWIVESLSTERPRTRSANDLSVIYYVNNNRMETDVSTSQIPPCQHPALRPMEDALRFRLENPYAPATAPAPAASASSPARGQESQRAH